MNTQEILIAGKELLSDPKHWIKGTLDDGCGGYCAWGAVRKVGKVPAVQLSSLNENYFEAVEILDRISGGDMTRFNDDPETTHVAIMNLFDLAIQETNHG